MKIISKLKQISKLFFIEPLLEAKQNYLKIYSKNKRKALLILGTFILISIGLFHLSHLFFSQFTYQDINNTFPITDNSVTINSNVLPGFVGANPVGTDEFKKLLNEYIWPIFEDFIGNTPDPTGNTDCRDVANNGCTFIYFNRLQKDSCNNVLFAQSPTQLTSSLFYSNKLIEIIFPIFTILCIIQGFNFFSNDNRTGLKAFVMRFFSSLGLFMFTPIILSLSVLGMNLFSNAILEGISLSSKLSELCINILLGMSKQGGIEALLNGNFFEFLFRNSFLGQIITLISFIVPFGLLLLLLIYVCFQFVIRFLNLYFLAVVYPIVVVFAVHPKTQNIVNSYFKQWTTFVIQQPIFLIGLKIVLDMLGPLFNNNTFNPSYLIIFIGALLFLASINLFTARIWGDVYTAVSQNVTSAIGAGLTTNALRSLIPRGGNKSSNLINLDKGLISGNVNVDLSKRTQPTTQKTDTVSNPTESNPLNKKTAEPKDNRSSITKELDGAGYDVSSNRDGTTTVGGNFYTNGNDKGEYASMYISKEDAINDGVSPEQVKQVQLNNLNVMDSSNGKRMKNYNHNVTEIAASNGIVARDIGIGSNSIDSKVKKSMDISKNSNLGNGIQGIALRNDLANGNRQNMADNRIKIIAYREVINNKMNGNS